MLTLLFMVVKFAPPFKTLLNGEALTGNAEGNPVPMFKDSA